MEHQMGYASAEFPANLAQPIVTISQPVYLRDDCEVLLYEACGLLSATNLKSNKKLLDWYCGRLEYWFNNNTDELHQKAAYEIARLELKREPKAWSLHV